MSVLKTLIATTALVAVGASATLAQNATQQDMTQGSSTFLETADRSMMLGSNLWEAEVYAPRKGAMETRGTDQNATGQSSGAQSSDDRAVTGQMSGSGRDWNEDAYEEIGSIVDLLVSQDGSIEAIMIEVGGFLGMGGKTVAIAADTVEWNRDDAADADARTVRLVVPVTREQLEDAPDFDLAGDGSMGSQRGTGDQSDNDPARETMVEQGGAGATAMSQDDSAARSNTDTSMQSRNDGRSMQARDGYIDLGMDEMTAENLQAAEIRGPNDEDIGSVSELILSEDGQVTHALVDVGGWLGIGSRTIALSFDEVQVMRADDGDEVVIYVNYTEEEIENMPEYEG